MTPKEFVQDFFPFARKAEEITRISGIFILAQAAIESGWGRVAPLNNFFGIKDSDGLNGNEQLLVTTEYSRQMDLKFPEIISVAPVLINGVKYFKYRIKDYFRKYDSAADCFEDHANFFFRNPRYRLALNVKHDAEQFAQMVAKAGYATDPNYSETLLKVIGMIRMEIAKLENHG
jgi:flagellum-specific peptidoglycan hydrolase FlgJ